MVTLFEEIFCTIYIDLLLKQREISNTQKAYCFTSLTLFNFQEQQLNN